jgi:hypothetical protein
MTPFEEILEEIHELHLAKQKGYGRRGEPFHNIKSGADFLGLPWWQGCAMRMNDKMGRLSAVANGSDLGAEGIEDALLDIATYAVIGLALYREEKVLAVDEVELARSKQNHPAFKGGQATYRNGDFFVEIFREED